MQREAKVASSDLLIAATRQDELNMMCCVLARKLGCPNTIARVRNPDYTEQLYLLREELGLSMTVNPEWTAAREIFRASAVSRLFEARLLRQGASGNRGDRGAGG